MQAASLQGWPIIAADLYDPGLKLAKDIGAMHCINSRDVDACSEIKDSRKNYLNTLLITQGYQISSKWDMILSAKMEKSF